MFFGVLRRLIVDIDFVDVAPLPILAWLEGLNEGMLALSSVLTGVFIFGTIAAAYVTAGQAKSKVHPLIAALKTLFTALRSSRRNSFYRSNMITCLV
jgi:hypothetical protein